LRCDWHDQRSHLLWGADARLTQCMLHANLGPQSEALPLRWAATRTARQATGGEAGYSPDGPGRRWRHMGTGANLSSQCVGWRAFGPAPTQSRQGPQVGLMAGGHQAGVSVGTERAPW